MTQPRRNLGLLLTLATFAAPLHAFDLQDTFKEGVELLSSGDKAGALAKFQQALAENPSNEEAYELWSTTEHEVWLDMMVEGGEFELIARRFMQKVRDGEQERSDDTDAINELVRVLENSDDVIERRNAVQQLSANHGEYAVPRLIKMLAAEDGTDTSVIGMVSLAAMSSGVVLPLIEALNTDNEFQKMNVAHTLGRIGDRRAAGALAELAASGSNTVAAAAAVAAEKCGSQGAPALSLFLEEGAMYYARDARILRPFDVSDVIWHWRDGELVGDMQPRAIYAESLAKRSFTRALSTDPNSVDALAGLARSAATIESKLASLEDVDQALLDSAASGNLAVAVAGPAALDAALGQVLDSGDVLAGIAVCRNLANLATSATDNLRKAAAEGAGPIRAEASIALANIAAQNGSALDANLIENLGMSAAREVVRVVVHIDGDANRVSTVASAMEGQAVNITSYETGALGLISLRQLPGVDAILLGDGLSDLTLDQVISDIESMDHMSRAALFVLSSSEANSAYGDRDRVSSVIEGSDFSDILAAFEGDPSGDRAEAVDLARRSAGALAHVAARGGSIDGALDALANVAANRDNDAVIIPAMQALGYGGGSGQVSALVSVLGNGDRSDEARVTAADALSGIFGRDTVSTGDAAGLRDVVTDAGNSLAVRQAASRALGRAQVSAAERASIVDELAAGNANQ